MFPWSFLCLKCKTQRDRWQCFPPKSFFTFSIPFYFSIVSNVVLSIDLKNSKNQKIKLSPFLFMVDFLPVIFLSPPCRCCGWIMSWHSESHWWLAGRCWRISPPGWVWTPSLMLFGLFCLIQGRVEFCLSIGEGHILWILLKYCTKFEASVTQARVTHLGWLGF